MTTKPLAIVLTCFLLTACDQRASTPTPSGQTGPAHLSSDLKPGANDASGGNQRGGGNQQGDGNQTGGGNQKAGGNETVSNTSTNVKPRDPAVDDKDPANPLKIEALTLGEDEWKKKLTEEEYYVLRKKGTERAFTGKYDKFYKPGKYLCAACGLELFTSDTKFDSGCGWPAFYAAKAGDRVKLHKDFSGGMVRTEVTCARCDGHLGHVFENEGYSKKLVPTGERFCINSVSIKFVPAEGPLRENIADEPKKDAGK